MKLVHLLFLLFYSLIIIRAATLKCHSRRLLHRKLWLADKLNIPVGVPSDFTHLCAPDPDNKEGLPFRCQCRDDLASSPECVAVDGKSLSPRATIALKTCQKFCTCEESLDTKLELAMSAVSLPEPEFRKLQRLTPRNCRKICTSQEECFNKRNRGNCPWMICRIQETYDKMEFYIGHCWNPVESPLVRGFVGAMAVDLIAATTAEIANTAASALGALTGRAIRNIDGVEEGSRSEGLDDFKCLCNSTYASTACCQFDRVLTEVFLQ